MASCPNFTTTTEEEACLYAQQLATSSILPMTLTSAINLGIFDVIARAGSAACLSPSEVAAHLPAQNPQAAAEMLDRIMRLLASHSVLTCSVDETSGERRYGAAPVVKYLAKAGEDGASMGAYGLLIQDKVVMESWYYLKDAVLGEGIPFHKAHGITIFEYNNIDSRFKNVFNEGMRNHSTIITKNILDAYKGFDDVNVLVDVGGGVGGTLNMIVKKCPHVKGINFDLPHIISEAKSIPGVEHVCGDMFESVPSGDAIFMKWILHGWSEEQCLKLLKNCWKALPEKGKVIVMESILPVNPEPTTAAQAAIAIDLIMLTQSPGGKVRTEKEFDSLAKGAGFSGSKVICGYANFWVLEFYKSGHKD